MAKDNKNLKNKLKEYQKLIDESIDENTISYWGNEISKINRTLESRNKNRLKNEKQFKKSNGYKNKNK